MNLIEKMKVLVPMAASLAFMTGTAFAGDVCSLRDVIQPAIEQAAEAAACNLDGAYVSPQLIAAQVKNECNAKLSSNCKRCVVEGALRGAVTARTLVREGFLNSGAVISTLAEIYKLKDQLCK